MENYYPLLSNATKLFKENRDKFNTYSLAECCDLINKILYGLSAGKGSSKIPYKGFEIGTFGRLTNRNCNLNNMYFIDQSITGYYERRYKL